MAFNNKKTRRRTFREPAEKPEFDQQIIDLARVTRVMEGGKRLRFRACVALGDKKGRIGIGIAKGADVTIAINKAVSKAKKKIINIPIVKGTIPHSIREKFGAAKILLKPAPKGSGIIAGGAVRIILELSGLQNVVSKILGTNNKINNAKATVNALSKLKTPPSAEKEKEEPAVKEEQSKEPSSVKTPADKKPEIKDKPKK